MKKILTTTALAMLMTAPAFAGAFVNGGFEDGTDSGWTAKGVYRGGISNPNLDATDFTGTTNRSAVISSGYVDPNVGAALGTTVYSGSFGYRVEDTTFGGNGSLLQQAVTNYTDPTIFFVWKAVLEGAHGVNDAAVIKIELLDQTSGTLLVSRTYAAVSSSVDSRFTLSSNGYYYTSAWQVEQINIDASLSGHNFLLSVIAADCQPTGHTGYLYIDGFGAQNPTTDVPEPASLALLGAGLAGLAMARRRRK